MTSQKKTYIIHILMIMGLVLPALIPVGSWVLAQEQLKHFSSSHSIYTSEFGIESPAGMAYSPEADSFIIWAADDAWHIIAAHEDMGGKLNLAQPVENPLGVGFEDQSNSLFILSADNAELAKIDVGQSGLPDTSNEAATRFNIRSFDLQDAQGITFDPATGRLFILDARRLQVLVVSPHPAQGFDGASAAANNRIRRLSVESLSRSGLRGIAFNPNNGHLYVGSPDERKVYELAETGERVSTYDVSDLNLDSPGTMLFAPSRDVTDDPNIMDLYILDSGQNSKHSAASTTDQRSTSQKGQIVELSLQAPAALPPGTTVLSATLVRTIDTSNVSWNPSSPDPSGIDYWPARQHLLIVDSEVDEMPNYYVGKNVFESTTSGVLTNTCDTTSYSDEPSGLAINPANNHLFISDDNGSFDSIYEVSLGADNTYCTADDIVTTTNVNSLYNVRDAEDVAYGNNTLFIAGGDNAEVYIVPLGANGVLGGGDDGSMSHFDTAALGFNDLEGIGYNSNGSGTLFIVSTIGTERYLGETTKSGTLLRAYNLSFMGSRGNLRSDVAYAPSSQNSAVKNIYIVSRGVDNDNNPNENDGKVWEISISTPVTPTPPPAVPVQVSVTIGGSNVGSYTVASERSVSHHYGINQGPVHVFSTNGLPIFTSQRAIFGSSFNSIVGYPADQLTTDYWFTSYDNIGMTTYLVIGNPSGSTALVDVYIGGVKRNLLPYSIAPGQRIFPLYNLNSGPVHVVSINGIKIFASERTKYLNSFNEVMGYPGNQLTTDYWFTSYDNMGMITYLVIGNPSTSTALVDVYIAGVKRNTTPYSIAPGQRIFPRYNLNAGPVHVVSINGVGIFTSERSKFGESFNEVMGYPGNQLTTDYWFTSYDDVGMITYLVIGNPSASTALVDVYIAGVKKNTSPYSIAPGQRLFPRYAVNNGPVHVVSTNGVNIFTSERAKYLNSFNEILGLADSQLTTDYWFTSYDDVGMSTFLVIAAP